jgi:hypothetical protein
MESSEYIQQQYVEFRKLYRNWFKELSSNFVDFKKDTVKYYKEQMDNSHQEMVTLFYNNVRSYLQILSEKDNSFFDNCQDFYSCIKYSEMMSTEKGKDEEYRKGQMIYLNKLCYMTIMLNKSGEEQSEFPESPELLLKFLANIQTLDGTNMENLMKNFENAFNPESFNDADKTFIRDNPLLSELAEEISKEIQIPESFKSLQNPQDIFKLMFNKEGKDFMEGMVKSVGSKIQDKIKNGQLDEKDLFNQAQKMMGTVFNNNPMFSGMPGFSGNDEPEEDTEQKKIELRNKLKQKLKQKRN